MYKKRDYQILNRGIHFITGVSKGSPFPVGVIGLKEY